MSRCFVGSALLLAALAAPLTARAQCYPDPGGAACCSDLTGDACLGVVRAARPDGVVSDIFRTSDGLFAPQLTFATYMRGVNGCIGYTHTPTILEGYTCGAIGSNPPGGNDPAFHANSLDWYWTQIIRTRDDGSAVVDGEPGFYIPWRGRIYDLNGEANRVILFPITDHPPLPCEAFEYTVWLSNNPDATAIAPESAPDPAMWNPARLIRAFTEGWTRNPLATGADRDRGDLDSWLHDAASGNAVADALATVWALPCGLSFRYVAIQGGNNGNPGPECAFHSQEDELDAVAGLNEDDTAICIDADGDGHRAASCGGGDCDDADPAVHPGAFEPCDATRDFDCQPAIACPEGTRCDGTGSGLCVSTCFEGGCSTGFTCTPEGLCVESSCAMRTEPCPDGTLCRDGACVAPCEGVVCPAGRLCAGGACIDPCAGVLCPSMQVCVAGEPGATTVCGPACTCTELATSLCGVDRACDARPGSDGFGHCVDPGCEVVTCGPGEACAGGACVDACAGVTCPSGQVCTLGECVVDRCAGIRCPDSQVCRDGACFAACDGVMCSDGMMCRDGACVPDRCAGIDCGADFRCVEGTCVPTGVESDAGVVGRMDAGTTRMPSTGGCCRVGGGSRSTSGLALVLAALAAWAWRRRR